MVGRLTGLRFAAAPESSESQGHSLALEKSKIQDMKYVFYWMQIVSVPLHSWKIKMNHCKLGPSYKGQYRAYNECLVHDIKRGAGHYKVSPVININLSLLYLLWPVHSWQYTKKDYNWLYFISINNLLHLSRTRKVTSLLLFMVKALTLPVGF